MKKIVITLSLAAATMLVASDMRTEIAVTAGHNKFDTSSKMENAGLYGARVTLYETEVNKYGFQLGYDGIKDLKYEKNTDNKIETNLHRFYGHLVIDGEQEYRVTPYLYMGGGYEYLSEEIKGERSQGFADLGLGFKYYPTAGISLLLEFGALGKFDTHDVDYNAKVGLGYTFGSPYEEKQEVIDVLDTENKMPELNSIPVKRNYMDKTEVKESLPQVTPFLEPENDTAVVEDKIDTQEGVIDSTLEMIEEAPVEAPVTKKSAPTTSAEEVTVFKTYSKDTMVISDKPEQTVAKNYKDFYVQMAAYDRSSTKPILNTLSSNGYENTSVKKRGKTKLVLVGPYATFGDASMARGALLSIADDAFITNKPL